MPTDRESLLRRALWAAAVFNVGGAFIFGFPASALGQFAELPTTVPVAYRAMTAMFVLLFAAAYAWLAQHRPLDRAFVMFGAIGKACAFATVVLLWLAGETGSRSVLMISGDLAFAAFFAWCLLGTPKPIS